MGSSVLVLGATGKTGCRLIPLLVERGVAVRAASRGASPAKPGVEPVRFDWRDEATYGPALAGVDAVYLVTMHIAGTVADSVAQVERLIDRATASGVRRIVELSAYGVERATPNDPMRRIGLAVQRSGIPHTLLRPAAFMQNFSETHLFDLRRHRRAGRDRDAGRRAAGQLRVDRRHRRGRGRRVDRGRSRGRGYTLTGPTALTVPEVAEHISVAAGRPIRYVEVGPEPVRAALLAAGAPAEYADYVTGFYIRYVMATSSGELPSVTADIAMVTGRPATPFAEFAALEAAAWRRG